MIIGVSYFLTFNKLDLVFDILDELKTGVIRKLTCKDARNFELR